MRWFGFGFNAFGQICIHEGLTKGACGDAVKEVKVLNPTELTSHVDNRECCLKSDCKIKASWSRRASLHFHSKSRRVNKNN